MKINTNNHIKYGTILEVQDLTGEGTSDVIMLIDNTSYGGEYNCMALDISTKTILGDYTDVKDFVNNVNITRVVGQFDEFFSIQ